MKPCDFDGLSISKIKALVNGATEEEQKKFVDLLYSDSRVACHTLAKQIQKKAIAYAKEKERMAMIFEYEKNASLEGYKFVAGIDEAGRGPLVGPVVAATVILGPDSDWSGIDDSKKLTSEQRAYFYDRIITEALGYGIGVASHEEIDSINILNATKYAMARSIEAMSITPDLLLIDAVKLTDIPTKQISLIKGDSKSASIAAASILAKVTRDRMMVALHEKYPHYGFDQHKGYGTDRHYAAIRTHGLIPEHRKTFFKGFIW
ncbi:MAG TPA: ribonuclease HII [Clostridiales bacterium UBA8960]|jgi:ribonuclease HII|nr:ribonuclease HII [Clostridiales bacterium UBA8960]